MPVSTIKFITILDVFEKIEPVLDFVKKAEGIWCLHILAPSPARSYIKESKIQESDIGIASKDASSVFVSESMIEKNRVGIAVYSKKPYSPESKIEFDKSMMFFW